jgi:hypothetical protein
MAVPITTKDMEKDVLAGLAGVRGSERSSRSVSGPHTPPSPARVNSTAGLSHDTSRVGSDRGTPGASPTHPTHAWHAGRGDGLPHDDSDDRRGTKP